MFRIQEIDFYDLSNDSDARENYTLCRILVIWTEEIWRYSLPSPRLRWAIHRRLRWCKLGVGLVVCLIWQWALEPKYIWKLKCPDKIRQESTTLSRQLLHSLMKPGPPQIVVTYALTRRGHRDLHLLLFEPKRACVSLLHGPTKLQLFNIYYWKKVLPSSWGTTKTVLPSSWRFNLCGRAK